MFILSERWPDDTCGYHHGDRGGGRGGGWWWAAYSIDSHTQFLSDTLYRIPVLCHISNEGHHMSPERLNFILILRSTSD